MDPATWTWTAADSLFLALVREVHRRGMRIIMDYSWNHTGITFWAWQDVLAASASSPLRRLVRDRALRRSGDRRYQRVPLPRLGRRALAAGVEEGWPAAGPDPRRRSRGTSSRACGTWCSTSPAAGWTPMATAIPRTGLTVSGSTWPRWSRSASGATTGASSEASIRRRTWWARSGGRSGPTGCTTRRPGSRAMSSMR